MKRHHQRVENLTRYFPKLSRAERALCCFALRNISDQHKDIHLGTLPFVPRCVAIACLEMLANNAPDRRRAYLKVLVKLEYYGFVEGQRPAARFLMSLNDNLVIKRFGQHPERGVAIPGLPKRQVRAGVKWSLPHKAYIPNEGVTVVEMMKLTCLSPGTWSIECPENRQSLVELYLMDNCQTHKQRKRGCR